MALQIQKLNKTTGQVETSAYARVQKVSGGKDGFRAKVLIFANATMASKDGAKVIGRMEIKYDYNEASAENAIAEAYTVIKALPDWAGAVDV